MMSSPRSNVAVAVRNLHVLRINSSELFSIAIGQSIQRSLGDVEAVRGVVDRKDVDGLPIVGKGVAGATLQGGFVSK